VAESASATAAPDVNVHGTIALGAFDATDTTSGSAANQQDGDLCVATSGFNDISQGTAVMIGNSTGQTIAVTALGAGVLRQDSGGVLHCTFAFGTLVSGGQPLYTVTISHRGTQTFSPDQIAAGISLSLGQ
jgi:hypothetical protein